MQFEIKKIDELWEYLKSTLESVNEWSPNIANECITYIKGKFLGKIRTDLDLYVGVDYPYVDKLYRNAYYHHYSSKLSKYNKNCIRLSFFAGEIYDSDFFDVNKSKSEIEEKLYGFLILQPIPRSIIGRNMLRPDLFQDKSEYNIVFTKEDVSINGLKLCVKGFPHCSQDTEMMVCAETTLWLITEFFSHKYTDYKSILPYDLHKLLASTSYERQIPSNGLDALQMSYGLRELGFGVKTYSISDGSYSKNDLYRIIKIYVDSGIPIIAPIGNNKDEGHVFSIIGRTKFKPDENFKLKPLENAELHNGSILYDYYDQPFKYIIIDDNLSPYSEITLEDPDCNYPDWDDYSIEAAIVPLHTRIYIEADKAEKKAIEWIKAISIDITTLPSFILRTFLTSSKSYKNYVALNEVFSNEIKNEIINTDIPKFIWVVELSQPELLEKEEACGIILIDPTEPNGNVLCTFIENKYIEPSNTDKKYEPYSLPLPPFKSFFNLKIVE